MDEERHCPMERRTFLKGFAGGLAFVLLAPYSRIAEARRKPVGPPSPLFGISEIPDDPFSGGVNRHLGIDNLLELMGDEGLKFYGSPTEGPQSGANGMIWPNDVVLVKVNAQWKYRGCTNSDLIRGLIQAILDHPDGFIGEVVIVENGQGRGSLNCDTPNSYDGDTSVRANANDESHSFQYLVDTVFSESRVSAYLLDDIRGNFIAGTDHVTEGYRKYKKVSYPCFTTAGGHRVELREGTWTGAAYRQNLKLINVPVLKHHDKGGSEITASLKHFYGILSMKDGQVKSRHYRALGAACGTMVAAVRTPVLNIIDAIWVSHTSLKGYPASATHRANQILASQDPVALDYWAAREILYPIDYNKRHHPKAARIKKWLKKAWKTINRYGNLYRPEAGIMIHQVNKDPDNMVVHTRSAGGPG